MQIDFYLLTRHEPAAVVAQLVAKAWPAHPEIVISGPADALRSADAMLWEKPGNRFLPHGIDQPEAPICLQQAVPEACPVLVHLHRTTTIPAGRFERVLEVVGPDEAERVPARERFRAWKKTGATVRHHKI